MAGGSSPKSTYFVEIIWSTRERFKAGSPGAATIVSEVMGSSDGIVGIEGIVGGELPPSAEVAEVGGVKPLEKLPSPRDPLLGMPPSSPDSDPVGCVCMWLAG